MDRPADIVTLRNDLDGRVIAPGDASYDEARAVFYGGCDRRPSAVVRAANADDVARVITFARERGTELAMRSGGHSGAGHITTDEGIVLDLADMRALEIDVEGQTAWVEPGLPRAPSRPRSVTTGSRRIREAYPGRTWDRLAAIKARYDPTNPFRLDQNTPPARD